MISPVLEVRDLLRLISVEPHRAALREQAEKRGLPVDASQRTTDRVSPGVDAATNAAGVESMYRTPGDPGAAHRRVEQAGFQPGAREFVPGSGAPVQIEAPPAMPTERELLCRAVLGAADAADEGIRRLGWRAVIITRNLRYVECPGDPLALIVTSSGQIEPGASDESLFPCFFEWVPGGRFYRCTQAARLKHAQLEERYLKDPGYWYNFSIKKGRLDAI
jgi:hypothetical protein